MAILKTLSNYMDSDSTKATAYGADITPTITSTYAQNVFASSGATPNYPKPQSMFKIYFSINPVIGTLIDYKKQIIEQTTKSEMISNIIEKEKSSYEQTYEKYFNEALSVSIGSTSVKTKSWVTHTSNKVRLADLDAIIDMASLKVLSYELGKMCKNYVLPNISMKTKIFNEYNRRRKFYTGNSEYGDLTLTFFDVKENPVQQFIFNYLKFINNDFFMKGNENWFNVFSRNEWNQLSESGSNQITNSIQSYDYNPFGFTTESNIQFIQSITICEYFMDKCMVYTIINPKITNIDFGSANRGSMEGKEIKVTFSIEGITNDMTTVSNFTRDSSVKAAAYYRSMVNAPITQKLAGFFQTRYLKESSFLKGIYNSILSTYINGEKKFNWSNIKQQVFDTTRMIGQASSVNTIDKFSEMSSTYKSLSSSDKKKFLFNASRDPTTIIGQTTYKTFL